jgi:hypothetical protein
LIFPFFSSAEEDPFKPKYPMVGAVTEIGSRSALDASWRREFGAWPQFEQRSDLGKLAWQAAKAWTEIAQAMAALQAARDDLRKAADIVAHALRAKTRISL